MSDTKECPFCAETIKAAAIVCRYCNRDLVEFAIATKTASYSSLSEEPRAANNSDKPFRCTPSQPSVSRATELGDEKVYFADWGVTVSNSRAVIDGTTYVIANITTVGKLVLPAERSGWIAGAIVGLMITMAGVGIEVPAFTGLGLVFLVSGVAFAAAQKKKYAVRIATSAGESNALVDRDERKIQKIVDAINEAIVRRG